LIYFQLVNDLQYLWVNLLLFGVLELYVSKKVFCLYRKRLFIKERKFIKRRRERLFMQMYMKMKRVARRNKFIVQFPITVNKTKSLRAQQGRGVQTRSAVCAFWWEEPRADRPAVCSRARIISWWGQQCESATLICIVWLRAPCDPARTWPAQGAPWRGGSGAAGHFLTHLSRRPAGWLADALLAQQCTINALRFKFAIFLTCWQVANEAW